VVVIIALLIFGPRKLPELGKGLGEGMRGFKDAIKGTDSKAAAPAQAADATPHVTPQPPVPPSAENAPK
jgi:sec-independent protein translocase protein TatA